MDRKQLRAKCDRAAVGPWANDSAFVNGPNGFVAQADCVDTAAFIAEAKTAIPALLDEVERLHALDCNDDSLSIEDHLRAHVYRQARELRQARAALAEMIAARDEACEIAEKWLAVVTGDAPIFANGDTLHNKARIAELRKAGAK